MRKSNDHSIARNAQCYRQEQSFWLCSSAKAKSFTIGETRSFTKSKAFELYSLAKAQEQSF